ncbi:MAG: ferrochelatase [Acidobacteria bacterium]|nr:ferrochelatase [Acidobacteriota bacterium]
MGIPPDTAVLLLNMGGPLRADRVEPFLRELFNDRDIIRLGPAFLQPLIARIIVGARLKDVVQRYGEIGGGSPILRESAAQAAALRRALREAGRSEPVKLVFRYAAPRAEGMLRALRRDGIRRLLPVTLYPHDCRATTGSSLRDLERRAAGFGMEILEGVRHYATDEDFLSSVEERIREALRERPGATVLFSAHSLPRKQVEQGDPYEREIRATVAALEARLGPLPGGFRLAFQSKVGPIPWLEPNVADVIPELAGREVVVVPIAFVSEHIETLHELDIEYAHLARERGVAAWIRVPTPGTHPAYIRCLTRRTLAALKA